MTTVLLVHDDIATIAVARRVLVSEGLEVALATSAADAIISFGQRSPGLIVLAPAVDGDRGFGVYEEIRALPQGEHVRFLLLGQDIPGAQGTATVALPLHADTFRARVRALLHSEGGGWEASGTPPEPEPEPEPEGAPEVDSPNPWRVAPASDAVATDEGLANQLFGDMQAAAPATGAHELVPAIPPELLALPIAPAPAPEPIKWDALELAEETQARDAAAKRLEEESQARQQAEARAAETGRRKAELEAAREELERKASEEAERSFEAEARAKAERAQLEEQEQAIAEAGARLEAAQKAREAAEASRREAQTRKVELERASKRSRRQAEAVEVQLAELERARAEAEARHAAEQKAREEAELRSLEASERLAQAAEAARLAEAQAQAEAGARAEAEKVRAELEGQLESESQARLIAERKAENARVRHAQAQQAARETAARAKKEAAQLEALEARRTEAEASLTEAAEARARAEALVLEASERRTTLERAAEEAEARAKEESAQLERLERARAASAVKLEAEQAAWVGIEARLAELTERRTQLEREVQEAEARAEAEAGERAALESSLSETELRTRALAEQRAAFEERARAAAERAEPIQPPAPPEPVRPPAIEPQRRTLRPLAGGRWRPPVTAPAPAAIELPPFAADAGTPWPEGPVEPRSPSFDLSGPLAELGAAGFLARVWQERITGRFDFELRDGARALFFEEGRLVAALSSAPVDRLEALAQRDGLITRAQERALRAEPTPLVPRQLAVRMVELRLIKGTELYALVRRHLEQVAYALFTDEPCPYAYSTDLAPPELRVALPVHPLAFMVEGVRRKGDFDRLNQALGGPTALVRAREGAPEPTELGLSARERRLAALIDGLRTIEELVFASGLDPQAAVKLLYALQAAHAVEVLPQEPVPAAGNEPERLIDLSRVTEKYEQVRQGDYFEILGLPRESTGYEVKQAFERLAREFHPVRFAGVDDPSLPARLEEIGRMVAEAADVLSDDHTRRAYARHLADAS